MIARQSKGAVALHIDESRIACFMRALACLSLILLLSAAGPGPVRAEKKSKEQNPPTSTAKVMQPDLSKPLTLDEAIRIGLQNQNTVGIARSQVEAARARVTQARAQYFPSIAPLYRYRNENIAINGTTQHVDQGETSIGLTQLIFDMGKREENVAASRSNQKASEFNVLDTRQTVIADVTTRFYEVLRSKELVRVAESSVERAKTTLDATKAFVEAGTAPKKDILQAQADYDNAQVQLIVARNDVRVAGTFLKNSMGILTSLPVIVEDTRPAAPSAAPDTTGTQAYVARAFATRPDLRRDTEFISSDRHQVKIAQINSGFQVQADVTEGYRVDPSPGENRSFGTSFTYPLFDAGASRAAVRAAKATLDQSRLQLDLTKQNIQLEVEQSYLTREESRQRYMAAESALKAAQENYAAAREAQKEGAGTIIDVITAQTQLVTAETNAVQSIYDYYTSDARLRRAVGENDPYPKGR